MIYLIGVISLIMLFAAWMLHSWISSHGLVVIMDDKWVLQSQGWAAFMPMTLMFVFLGVVLGFSLGAMLSKELAQYLTERQNEVKKDAQMRLAEQQKSSDQHLQKVLQHRTDALKKDNDALRSDNQKLGQENNTLKHKIDIIENRLKGAQQKNARLKKHI